jgi:hypothetical protein
LKLYLFSLAPELASPLRALAPSVGGAADSAAAGPRRSSPATVAARGAPGWERFLGGTSSNLTFTSEEARKFRRTKVVAIFLHFLSLHIYLSDLFKVPFRIYAEKSKVQRCNGTAGLGYLKVTVICPYKSHD